jgi:hypothetical protein
METKTMRTPSSIRNVRVQTGLHPAAYALLAACVVWITAVAWFFFAAAAYTALQIAVVAGFAAAFLMVPFWLSRLSGIGPVGGSFREWLDSDLEVVDGTIEARKALIMIMCAPVAGAAGLTAVSSVAYLVAAGII